MVMSLRRGRSTAKQAKNSAANQRRILQTGGVQSPKKQLTQGQPQVGAVQKTQKQLVQAQRAAQKQRRMPQVGAVQSPQKQLTRSPAPTTTAAKKTTGRSQPVVNRPTYTHLSEKEMMAYIKNADEQEKKYTEIKNRPRGAYKGALITKKSGGVAKKK